MGPWPWAVIMIGIGAMLGVAMIWLRGEVAYPLVLIWAFAGIAIKQNETLPVMVTAAVAALALAIFLALWRGIRPRFLIQTVHRHA